jgi:hypothetical protein
VAAMNRRLHWPQPKQSAVGYTPSSTNCQQLAQDGCSPLTVLAALMRFLIPAIQYLDRARGNDRTRAVFHCPPCQHETGD